MARVNVVAVKLMRCSASAMRRVPAISGVAWKNCMEHTQDGRSKKTGISDEYTVEYARETRQTADASRFLIVLPVGLGDAVVVGSNAVDQIIKNAPDVYGKIDILGNAIQAEVFRHDPRIGRIIHIQPALFPTTNVSTWGRAFIPASRAASLLHFLRECRYDAVFPGIVAPGLYARLNSRVMHSLIYMVLKEWVTQGTLAHTHISTITRQNINGYFGTNAPCPEPGEDMPLYMSRAHIRQASKIMEHLKASSHVPAKRSWVVLVAPDTSSIVTRPPASLLAAGLAGALSRDPCLLACILPSYTNAASSEEMFTMLSASFEGRVFLAQREPRPTLLETAALIDQADVFLTGDTGVLHLALASKKLAEAYDCRCLPRNATKVITVFGGTNPDFYGYRCQSIIVGKSRKEQATLTTGITKEYSRSEGKNFFDHITPQQLTEALLSSGVCLTGPHGSPEWADEMAMLPMGKASRRAWLASPSCASHALRNERC